MADRTSGGREAVDKSKLAARRLQLQIHQNKGSIMQAELDIDNFMDQIDARRKQIEATGQQNAALADQLDKLSVDTREKE